MRARKRFGQHFLEPAWADKLVAAIEPRRDDRFLEIGPGPGALTLRLAPRVAHVTAVEVDRDLAAALQPRLPANVDLVVADFLQIDLGPLGASGPLRVAGNLPYNISSPILFRLLDAAKEHHVASAFRRKSKAGGCLPAEAGSHETLNEPANPRTPEPAIVDATLMLQREVAERLEAAPGSGEYGVLSISVQRHADVRRLLTLPPGAFRPPPRVHSAVVRLTFRRQPVEPRDDRVFDTMVRAMFTQRRKTLANALAAFAGTLGLDAATALQDADIDPTRRPETLDLAELTRLADRFAAAADR